MKRPGSATEIAVAAREALAAAIPALQGATAFDARVAARLLQVLQREQEQGAAAEAAERARLRALLPDTADELSLQALREQLCEAIAGGSMAPEQPQLLRHLWSTALAQLAIDNPAYRWRASLQASGGRGRAPSS